MTGITQNRQIPYFHCGPQKIWNNKKSKRVCKSYEDSITVCKQERYKLISGTDDN